MKKQILFSLCLLIVALFVGCSDDDENTFTGKNKIYLSSEDDLTLFETDEEKLTIDIDLTLASEKDMVLTFEVLDNTSNVIVLEGNPVTIKAGEKKGSFTVASSMLSLLNEQKRFEIVITKFPEENMALDKSIEVLVKPDIRIPELTESQKSLIAGYKTKYNFDLNDYLGVISYSLTVNSPIDGSNAFETEFTKDYTGKTIITLDEKSTADQPILKMVENPMGMNEYLYWVLRQETVDNSDMTTGEYASPYFRGMMEAINLNSESEETFAIMLDNIRLDMSTFAATSSINMEFTGDVYGDLIGVPYVYKYSAWDRLQKLISDKGTITVDQGEGTTADLPASEVEEGGGSCNPDVYLIYSTIDTDDWGNEPSNWFAPNASIDNKTGKMKFAYTFDHASSGGYTKVEVTYTKR